MSSLNSLYLKEETLETLLNGIKQKGEKGIELTISINDETNQWGQNLSAFVSQSKEERQAEKKKYYVGNGKCFWTNGSIKVAEKETISDNNINKLNNAIGGEKSDLLF